MTTMQLIPLLALVTLGIVLAVAVIQVIAFRSKRRNREADKSVDMGRRIISDDGYGIAAGAKDNSASNPRPLR